MKMSQSGNLLPIGENDVTNNQAPTRFTSSDGHVFWLMKNRCDERHRQLRRPLPIEATAWDYAAILDIVERAPDGKGYRFLNRNVKEWLASLKESPEEYERARHWYAALGSRICETMASHPRTPKPFYAFELARIPWTSLLVVAIRSLGLKRASVEQWINTIQSLSTKGIKPEEIEQAALIHQLKLRMNPPAMLTQGEVLELISLDHVKPRLVAESTFGFSTRGGWQECCQRIPETEFKRSGLIGKNNGATYLIRYKHRTFSWCIVRVRYRDFFTEQQEWWTILDENGKLMHKVDGGFITPESAMEFAEQRMASRFSLFGKSKTVNRWQKYSLSGAETYQEVLIQLDDWPADYEPRHYKTRNVLVHIRLSLRTVQDGRRVMYLDEIQSDWHADLFEQAKNAEEYSGSMKIPDAPFRKEWPLLALKVMIWWAQRQKLDGVALSPAHIQDLRWGGNGPPEVLYKKLLPDAALQLAQALGLTCGETEIQFRSSKWNIKQKGNEWVACNAQGMPYTKPFSNYGQAEKFCLLSSGKLSIKTAVIWLEELPQITGIPLYGAGKREQWIHVKTGLA